MFLTGLKGLIPGSGRSNDGGLEERREHHPAALFP